MHHGNETTTLRKTKMNLQTVYAAYATYFFQTTGCEAISFADWLAIDAEDRPGMEIYGHKGTK